MSWRPLKVIVVFEAWHYFFLNLHWTRLFMNSTSSWYNLTLTAFDSLILHVNNTALNTVKSITKSLHVSTNQSVYYVPSQRLIDIDKATIINFIYSSSELTLCAIENFFVPTTRKMTILTRIHFFFIELANNMLA